MKKAFKRNLITNPKLSNEKVIEKSITISHSIQIKIISKAQQSERIKITKKI